MKTMIKIARFNTIPVGKIAKKQYEGVRFCVVKITLLQTVFFGDFAHWDIWRDFFSFFSMIYFLSRVLQSERKKWFFLENNGSLKSKTSHKISHIAYTVCL